MTPPSPRDPIAAVTHPDPYPYYAALRAETPLYRDETLGLWVATSADAVTAALSHELCRVRPPAEPIPKPLLDSPAGAIFHHLVRMNDRPDRCPVKAAVTTTLSALSGPRAEEESRRHAETLAHGISPVSDPGLVSTFAFHLPVHVVASLVGVPADRLEEVAEWTAEFVGCLSPTATPAAIEAGKLAAGRLLDLFGTLVAGPEAIVANTIGFLSQAYEATAGLIGNTLLALAAHPEAQEKSDLAGVVQEVLRWDPSVQNTRRFLAGSGEVAGQPMREGDAILVVLAAANRDPSQNPDPDRFDPARKDRRLFTFGLGAHACPGEALAATIATAGVERLLAQGLDPGRLAKGASYRPSANVRIPLFAEAPC